MCKENLPKHGLLFREFRAQNPTHMGGKYQSPKHAMYPPLGQHTGRVNKEISGLEGHNLLKIHLITSSNIPGEPERVVTSKNSQH